MDLGGARCRTVKVAKLVLGFNSCDEAFNEDSSVSSLRIKLGNVQGKSVGAVVVGGRHGE